VFALVVAGQNLWQTYDTYFIRFTDTSVAGIQEGGNVAYQGISIGSIESIRIDPEDVESIIVEIDVEAGTPIKRDVVARIVPVGVTGISQIELSGGTSGAADLPPGSYISPGESTVTAVTESVQSVLTGIEDLLIDLEGVLANVEQQSIGNILSRIDSMLRENERVVSDLLVELDAAAGRLSEAADEIGALASAASEVTANIDLLVRRNSPDIEAAVATLNDTLRLLNNFAFQINSDPSLLIVPEDQ
jgi:phospholipid/cholesterol/gamma-HCH transport system substrate-binding protein